jgi:O-acetylhomoserine/O-acetylserine sulfhydrylase-like pyridoxal-dependent enzyme
MDQRGADPFSAGIEDAGDSIADLDQALRKVS